MPVFGSSGTLSLVAAGVVMLAHLFVRKHKKKTPTERFWNNLAFTQETPESIRYGREDFAPRPDDIFIVTYPKSGTTWMQQICHGLRTKGDMDFEEITCVVPWNICALDNGQSLSEEHRGNPRCFKTHDTYHQVPKGAKYIVIVRDPRDVLLSFHLFLCDWSKADPNEFTVADFSEVLFCGKGSRSGDYWNHLAGWIPHMHDKNVLFLFFEDMKKFLPRCMQLVADFMGISDPEAIAIATKQASFEFMRDHAGQFDDHYLARQITLRTGYVVEMGVGKVREGGGQVDVGKQSLSADILANLDRRWQEIIASKFHYPSYDAFYQQHGLKRGA